MTPLADPRSQDGSRGGGSPRAAVRHATPIVRTPTCPEHCSGRHTLDRVIACPSCRVAAYQVWSHEYLFTEGHNFHELRPVNGATPDGPRVRCTCGREFRR